MNIINGSKPAPILVMGIGNPILTDDSIGPRIARGIKARMPALDIVETMETGAGIMDIIAGYERLVIIDSIKTGNKPPGFLYRLQLSDADLPKNLSCAHGVDIISSIRLGRTFGCDMPKIITIFAVEIEDNTTFGESCTIAVTECMPSIIEEIIKDLNEG
jgi:hydrogenase maturation protease